MSRQFRRAIFVLALLGPALSDCGGSNSPATPTTPTVVPSTPATPEPSPAPVLGESCGLGPGSAEAKCTTTYPTYEADMEASITQLMHQSPEIFNFKDTRGSNPKVVSVGRYYEGLIQILGQKGYCAYFNGGAIQVKKTNRFDDSFVVLASSGYVRRNQYSVTCVPASFPVGTPSPPPDVAGCPLGGSEPIACGVDVPQYLGVVTAATQQVEQQYPQYFDFHDIAAGTTDGYKVVDQPGFIAALGKTLSGEGYCTKWNGDIELKASNTFSESYHIMTGSAHLRHDLYSFDGSCYPAGF
jgi:hypothetical protein